MIPYLAGVTIDYSQFNNGPQVTADKVLEMTLNGTFFDADKPESSTFTPTVFPVRNPEGKSFQGYMTEYFVNTGLESGFETGNTLNITYLLEKYINLTVTTDNLGVVVPQILTKYGSGKAVGIAGAFFKAASIAKFSKDINTLDVNLAVTIEVDGEAAIIAEFDSIAVAAIFSSLNGVIFGNVSKSSLGSISSFQTTLDITAD